MILSRSCKSGQKYGIPLEENYTHMMTCLQRYADSGLRTLVMAMKELDEREFMKAIEDIDKAEKVLENREEAKADWWERRRQLTRSYEGIERALVPVGVSGIEDLLQDDVYDTIHVRFLPSREP